MAAPYNPPVRGEDFVIRIALESMASPGSFKDTPTIAAGDFKVKKDGGAATNLTTLPTASGIEVTVTLSATEMTADNVFVQAIDQTSPKEWADFAFCIPTT